MEKSANKYKKIADKKYEPVGNFINYYIHNNNVSKAQLARDLGILPTTLNQYFKQNSLQFGILWKISKALNHNFIAQLSEYLHIPFETYRERELLAQLAEKQKRIEQLEAVLEYVGTGRDLSVQQQK